MKTENKERIVYKRVDGLIIHWIERMSRISMETMKLDIENEYTNGWDSIMIEKLKSTNSSVSKYLVKKYTHLNTMFKYELSVNLKYNKVIFDDAKFKSEYPPILARMILEDSLYYDWSKIRYEMISSKHSLDLDNLNFH